MRWEVLKRFESAIVNANCSLTPLLVVGGTRQDPEYLFVNKLNSSCEVTFLGIDKIDLPFEKLDLNDDQESLVSGNLVLCSQVLEHIWNHQNFFLNLAKLTRNDGYLWLNVPASNFSHGSPDYYSAGFSPDYLAKNLENNDFKIITLGAVGSKRYYYATHVLKEWLTKEEHENPLFNYNFKPGTVLGIIKKLIIDMSQRLFLILLSKNVTDSPKFATESYIFAKKIQS